ncbi:MAG: phosphopyruvate hydratase [Cuniculiplasma sp.]
MEDKLNISNTSLRIILDSRGNKTVEATVVLKSGSTGVCSAPSGASTGATEVIPFRDGNAEESLSYFNRNVRESLKNFNGLNQVGFDKLLKNIDGTENFAAMGGNVSTALSIALAKAVSREIGIPLYRYVGGNFRMKAPKPIGNVIGGGKHAINGTTFQEFLVSNDSSSFLEAIEINSLIHKRIGQKAKEIMKNVSIGVGDERAWVLSISDEEAMQLLKDAADEVSEERKVKTILGFDAAASSFYEKEKYVYREKKRDQGEQIQYILDAHKNYGFYFIEDPMDEADFEGHAAITKSLGNKALIVGDDLYTTNSARIRKGIELKATNGVLIKVNQIGTLTDTWDAVKTATEASMKNVISHRSGETTDDFIAHLSLAFSSTFIKSGTIGGERLAKLNELVRIQEEIEY